MDNQPTARRSFLKQVGTAAFTTSIFTGNIKGANDRIATAFIGVGVMGSENLQAAMKQPGVQAVAVCDVFQPNLERAAAIARKAGHQAKEVRDFRNILADKSIDAVAISTPDHWHPYMSVEACKAGKDVYVEKPVCLSVNEGQAMIESARKYKRVVQAGTWQRSGPHFKKACELIQSGAIGKVAYAHTWIYNNMPSEGIGNPPDSAPPADLDWELWLGPAPQRQFNPNRFGVYPKAYSYFRYFWDYAGGIVTDSGIHMIDIVQMAFNEAMPKAVTALGGKYWLKDNSETPDTLQISFEYPEFLGSWDHRSNNTEGTKARLMGITFHGTKGTLYVDRAHLQLTPESGSGVEPLDIPRGADSHPGHWANFIDCVRTRNKPNSDIETCVRSSLTCILGNASYRAKTRIDWDQASQKASQPEAQQYLYREYRSPWKLEV
jgi:predicted dehydrogenase